jgi:hypothetical protein
MRFDFAPQGVDPLDLDRGIGGFGGGEPGVRHRPEDPFGPDRVGSRFPLGGCFGFRDRGIVADFKAFPFLDAVLPEWRERIEECYGPVTRGGFAAEGEMERNYRRKGDREWVRIARKYGASGIILPADAPTRLPIRYSDGEYLLVVPPHEK